MLWAHFAGMTAALITIVLATPTQAQQPAPPPFATTKVEAPTTSISSAMAAISRCSSSHRTA